MQFEPPADTDPVGYAWLIDHFGVKVPRPRQLSYALRKGSPRELHDGDLVTKVFARAATPASTPSAHLEFCLKHEPLALDVLAILLERLDADQLAEHIRAKPLGKYARRLWFFYEYLTGRRLALPDLETGNYVPLLDPDAHFTGSPRNSGRHRIVNNLLGDQRFSPVVLRTERLRRWQSADLAARARSIVADYDPQVLARAVNYLYTRETMSSYEIEREVPNPSRAERFITLLRTAADRGDLDKPAVVTLQNAIVDPRFRDADYRADQNYVGQTLSWTAERVHYVSPKPDDVPSLMAGLLELMRRNQTTLHPVVLAAVASFGFVYIHPFHDGNGRLHRWLIHYVLARGGFTPDGLIFPVSAVMLSRRTEYDRCLERLSRPLLEVIDWRLRPDGSLQVDGETAAFYRYFDATTAAECLFDWIEATIDSELKAELDFLVRYQRARVAMQAVVDLPDRKAALFIKLCVQNQLHLSPAKRKAHFDMLTDAEVAALERVVADAYRRGGEAGSEGG
jgi:hypothetical protein